MFVHLQPSTIYGSILKHQPLTGFFFPHLRCHLSSPSSWPFPKRHFAMSCGELWVFGFKMKRIAVLSTHLKICMSQIRSSPQVRVKKYLKPPPRNRTRCKTQKTIKNKSVFLIPCDGEWWMLDFFTTLPQSYHIWLLKAGTLCVTSPTNDKITAFRTLITPPPNKHHAIFWRMSVVKPLCCLCLSSPKSFFSAARCDDVSKGNRNKRPLTNSLHIAGEVTWKTSLEAWQLQWREIFSATARVDRLYNSILML